MITKTSRPLEYIPAYEIFEAVLDLAGELNIPVKTENYDLFVAVLGEQVRVITAQDDWEEAFFEMDLQEVKDALNDKRLFQGLLRMYAFFTGRQTPASPHTGGYQNADLERDPFSRSLKDVTQEELCQAVERLVDVLNVPVRTRTYDLIFAICEEKERDQKAYDFERWWTEKVMSEDR